MTDNPNYFGRRKDDYIGPPTPVPKPSFWTELGIKLLTWAMVIFSVVTIAFAYQRYEPEIFPVVKDFTVEELISDGDVIEIRGNMVKARECDFDNVSVYTKRNNEEYSDLVNIVFGDAYTSSRAPISQTFGPWFITIPYEFTTLSVDIYATHSCNLFYQTTNKLSSFNIRKGKDGITLIEKQ